MHEETAEAPLNGASASRVANRVQAVVIGAGPAGLAAAAMLERAGVAALVLESSAVIGSSWRGRYDRLRLNTVSWISGLPGFPMPLRLGRWVARDDYVAYLEEYARRRRLRIQFGTAVARIDRDGPTWLVETSAGVLGTEAVIVATGHDRVPFTPDWPGRDAFAGELIHAASYRNPHPFLGRDVLVVACGNSGADIAADLARADVGQIWLATRTPPNVFPRELVGMPLTPSTLLMERLPARVFDTIGYALQRLIYGDLSRFGLPRAPIGVQSAMLARGISPVTDDGFIEAVRSGGLEIVPTIERFDGDVVVLDDGRRLSPDAVLVATGYRRGLEPLVGHLGVLNAGGSPTVHGAEQDPRARGLYFIGFQPKLSGQLHDIKGQARGIARAVLKARSLAEGGWTR